MRTPMKLRFVGLLWAFVSMIHPAASNVAQTTSSLEGVRTLPPPDRAPRVLVAKLNDQMINPVTADFIISVIERGEALKVPVIIELDTPGGLLQSTREIVKKQLSSTVPVITFVYPSGSRAASAGVFITMASHVAAMAPGTNIGAAHVVDITGSWPTERDQFTTVPLGIRSPLPGTARDVMSEKVMNDTVAWVEAIANYRGRNAEWAKAAVERSVSVPSEKALELGVIDLVASDLPELLQKLDGRTVRLESETVVLRTAGAAYEYSELNESQKILNTLANPNIAVLLLLMGLVLLGYELTHPGLWIPGIAGLISLLLAALALRMLPTNYAAILLIVAGIGLFLAELKFTSYGLLTLAGAICLFFGALALFQQPKPFIGASVGIVAGIVATVTLLVALLTFLVARAQLHPSQVGVESYVGQCAEVIVDLSPRGKVFFNGTYWDAVSRIPVARGGKVRIVALEGMVLHVEPADGNAPNSDAKATSG
ncbi:MAG: serine protease [Candidatus Sumerlaea sp.]|nr:MAG: serine protease [Candidatus Sumerlaea sp.]